jgi:probable phosphoglycerate mutase
VAADRTRLLLVRHGRARAGDEGIIAGKKGCTGLSDLGRQQAEALRDRLTSTDMHVDVVLTSVLPRAIETATIVGPAIGEAVSQDCDLCELHPGECDGMRWEEWRANGGFDPMTDPDRPLSPGGESLVTFARRAVTAVDRVVAEHAGASIVLVVHGGLIAAATLHLLGFDESLLRGERTMWLDPENTSLTEWHRDDRRRQWTLLRYNDAAHLEALR